MKKKKKLHSSLPHPQNASHFLHGIILFPTRSQSSFEPKGRRVSSSSSTSSISTWRLYPNDLAGAAGGVASRCTATRLRDASENGPWDGRSCFDSSPIGPWNNRLSLEQSGEKRIEPERRSTGGGVVARLKREEGGIPLMRCLRSCFESNRGDDGE